MFRRIILPIQIVVLLATWVSAQSAPVKLEWKFTAGEKYAVTMNQNISQSVTIHDTPMKTSNSTTTYMTWNVNKVLDDGSADMACTIDRMEMSVDIPNQEKIEVDTDKPGNNEGLGKQFEEMFAPMINKTMKQVMSTAGKISDVEIPENMFGGMAANPMMAQMMNPKQMGDMITKSSPVFPAKALAVGDSWDQESTSDTPVGKMHMKSKYTYSGPSKSEGKDVHQVDVKSEMQFEANEGSPIQVTVTDQDITGSLFFDVKSGKLHSNVMEQKMLMTVKAGPQEMKQEMTQSLTGSFQRK